MAERTATREVIVGDPQGLHLRAAHQLATRASQFASRIELINGAVRADAKSILSVMTLGAGLGTKLILRAEGADAEEAVEAMARWFRDGFPEEHPPADDSHSTTPPMSAPPGNNAES
jgi:phosphocarrier protein